MLAFCCSSFLSVCLRYMFIFLSITNETLALTKSSMSINDVEICWTTSGAVERQT